MLVLNGVLPVAVKDGNHVTPAGPIQSLFPQGERETALAIARDWYAKGWRPVLISKDVDDKGYYSFPTLFHYKNYDRAAKATATKKAKRKAA